jgi:hypothetical protein
MSSGLQISGRISTTAATPAATESIIETNNRKISLFFLIKGLNKTINSDSNSFCLSVAKNVLSISFLIIVPLNILMMPFIIVYNYCQAGDRQASETSLSKRQVTLIKTTQEANPTSTAITKLVGESEETNHNEVLPPPKSNSSTTSKLRDKEKEESSTLSKTEETNKMTLTVPVSNSSTTSVHQEISSSKKTEKLNNKEQVSITVLGIPKERNSQPPIEGNKNIFAMFRNAGTNFMKVLKPLSWWRAKPAVSAGVIDILPSLKEGDSYGVQLKTS